MCECMSAQKIEGNILQFLQSYLGFYVPELPMTTHTANCIFASRISYSRGHAIQMTFTRPVAFDERRKTRLNANSTFKQRRVKVRTESEKGREPDQPFAGLEFRQFYRL